MRQQIGQYNDQNDFQTNRHFHYFSQERGCIAGALAGWCFRTFILATDLTDRIHRNWVSRKLFLAARALTDLRAFRLNDHC